MTTQQVVARDDLLTFSPTASKAKKTRAPPSLPATSNSLAAAPLPSTPYIWWRDAPDSAFRIWDTVPSLGLLTEWALTKAELTALQKTHYRKRATFVPPIPKEDPKPPSWRRPD